MIRKMKVNFFCLLLTALGCICCNSDYIQKPRGYFKIPLPKKEYRKFDQPGFPYSFEYPVYAQVIQDTLFFDQKPENPYWINVDFPQFNARIHISYKAVRKHNLDTLINDAFTMSYKQHTYKASAIAKDQFVTKHGVSGVYFTLKGNTATANQFFATDSIKHFMRGALYFGVTPNEDSLRPVNAFLRADLKHLINTLTWAK